MRGRAVTETPNEAVLPLTAPDQQQRYAARARVELFDEDGRSIGVVEVRGKVTTRIDYDEHRTEQYDMLAPARVTQSTRFTMTTAGDAFVLPRGLPEVLHGDPPKPASAT